MALVTMWVAAPSLAWAGGAERTERQHARLEARQIERLQRAPARPGVELEATSRYLDRFGHLDTRPVRRVEAWAWTLEEPWEPAWSAQAVPAEPVRPLAVPAVPPAPPVTAPEPAE